MTATYRRHQVLLVSLRGLQSVAHGHDLRGQTGEVTQQDLDMLQLSTWV